jgi:hypothetical protein
MARFDFAKCRRLVPAAGQRGWKWQPGGGLIWLGTSPLRITRLRSLAPYFLRQFPVPTSGAHCCRT